MQEPILYEVAQGFILTQGGGILASMPGSASEDSEKVLRTLAEEAKRQGITRIKVSSVAAQTVMEESGIETSIVSDEEIDELDSIRDAILEKAGLAAKEAVDDLQRMRQEALAAAEQRISEESSREDLQLVNAIQALDEMDRFLNMTTERTVEWYGLHFPELQDLLRDNLALARLIQEFGRRDAFGKEALEKRGIGEKKAEAIVDAASRSKGGTVSDRDLRRIIGLSELTAKIAAEREKLAEYVETSMNRIAPNVTQVAGATIGARLIAKAGGLDRLARLPASTIQVLGAEKALFRALRTGSRPPKHGILFQHESVHMAPKWQRGKIARTIANKIAIAARIDYYRGEKEGGLTDTLQKRLDEIKIKYQAPPQRWQASQREQERREQRTGRMTAYGSRRDRSGGFRKQRGKTEKKRKRFQRKEQQ